MKHSVESNGGLVEDFSVSFKPSVSLSSVDSVCLGLAIEDWSSVVVTQCCVVPFPVVGRLHFTLTEILQLGF